jgi:hypothetical protein
MKSWLVYLGIGVALWMSACGAAVEDPAQIPDSSPGLHAVYMTGVEGSGDNGGGAECVWNFDHRDCYTSGNGTAWYRNSCTGEWRGKDIRCW